MNHHQGLEEWYLVMLNQWGMFKIQKHRENLYIGKDLAV